MKYNTQQPNIRMKWVRKKEREIYLEWGNKKDRINTIQISKWDEWENERCRNKRKRDIEESFQWMKYNKQQPNICIEWERGREINTNRMRDIERKLSKNEIKYATTKYLLEMRERGKDKEI